MNEKYEIRTRTTEALFKGEYVEYEEKYGFNSQTKEEVFLSSFVKENKNRLINNYKISQGLLTGDQIKEIRLKYGMNQKEFSFALGLGQVTVHRFEKGAIQTYADDEIIRLSKDPDDMYKFLNINADNFSEEQFIPLIENVKALQRFKRHQIAHFDLDDFKNLSLQTANVEDIAKTLVRKYNHHYDWLSIEINHISGAKLQILLYFIQAIALYVYKQPAFNQEIKMGKLGPMISEIAELYGQQKEVVVNEEVYLSNSLNKIVELIIDSYGQLELLLLVSLAKDEDPCIHTSFNEVITNESILKYFTKIYEI